MRGFRLAAAAALVLAWPAARAARAEATLTGRVVDDAGLPVPGATIIAESGDRVETDTTFEDGGFILPDLAAGTWDLTVSASGYKTLYRSGVSLAEDAVLEVELQVEFSYVETVLVTGSRSEQTLLTTPVTVTLVGDDELAVSPADNHADLLRSVPGLNVVQIGARDINFNARSATGRLANSQLVMVDGRSVYENYFGVVYWDLVTVTPQEIDQIEIVRTPGSSIWGPNALTGVINLRTKSPRELEGGSVSVAGGEVGTRSASFLWADAFDRFSYKISGSYFEQDPWERPDTLPSGAPMPAFARFENEGARQPKGDVRLDWDPSPEQTVSFRAGWAGANGLIHSALGPFRFDDGADHRYLEVDYERPSVHVKTYWNRLDAPNTLLLFGLPLQTTADTYAMDVVADNAAGKHRLTYGGSVRLNRLDMTIVPEEDARDDWGLFFEDAVRWTDKVQLVVGGRVDKFETTDEVFAPRVGVNFFPKPGHAIRFAYNKSFRSPSMIENGADIDLPALCPDGSGLFFQKTVGSLDLDMEELDAFEVGYTGMLGEKATLQATAYRQTLADNIRFLPVEFYDGDEASWTCPTDPAPFTAETFAFLNIGEVREQGVELAFHYRWSARAWMRASYAYKDDPKVTEADPALLQLNRAPEHEAAVGFGYRGERWSGSFEISYTDEAFFSDVLTPEFWGTTDDYVIVNGRLAHRFPKAGLEFAVAVTNLFDSHVQQHVFGDVIGRKVTVSVRHRW